MLVHFNPEHQTVLQTDASLYALGSVLSQIQPDGTERPICFSSKTLDWAQQQYTTTERECSAVVWATENHRTLLLGNPFTLETDHNALKYLLADKASVGGLARWSLKLQEFDMTVKYRRGSTLGAADFMSRIRENPDGSYVVGALPFSQDSWREKNPKELPELETV
jgi:hypothetical protein